MKDENNFIYAWSWGYIYIYKGFFTVKMVNYKRKKSKLNCDNTVKKKELNIWGWLNKLNVVRATTVIHIISTNTGLYKINSNIKLKSGSYRITMRPLPHF